MIRASGRCPSAATGAFLRVALLTGAAVTATVSRAEAAVDYWHGSDPGYYQPFQLQPPHRQKVRRSAPKKDEKAAAKETSANPQGPLVIAVSIAKQRVTIYDDKGVFAEAPVSTGMPGHPTPMGVFSIVQKHKFHHSNIYSNAPMPYMQRITWSGVAMHAGVLPGYPASHGCIRMPMAFAVKMWTWTKMGTRVFVTPGEIAMPASFSHPFLPALKVAPPPAVAALPPVESHADVKADKGAPAPAEVKLKLRSDVGHNDRPGAADAAVSRETRTAEAAVKSTVTWSDAQVGPAGEAKPEAEEAVKAESRSDELKVAEARSTETRSDANPAIGDNPDKAETTAEEPMVAARADGDDASAERPASARATAEPPKTEDAANAAETKPEPKLEAPAAEQASNALEAKSEPAKSETLKEEAVKAEAADPVENVGDKTKTAGNAPTGPALGEAKKDQTRLTETERPAAARPEPPKRTGQIAVFISRKDSKLYVRQNFEPLFQVPVTIASSDRPLGTHVFTAEVDKTDTNVLHWSVVSLPMSARADDLERVSSRRRRGATSPPVEAKLQPVQISPSEALDRITVPQEAMTRIAEALASGASIIVSDQGINQGETGEGTDFIVRLH